LSSSSAAIVSLTCAMKRSASFLPSLEADI
jgi:hypothetical protein